MTTKAADGLDEGRRCCNAGCDLRRNFSPDDGWYKVGVGFMCHACPEHRAAWEAYDAAQRADEDSYGEALQKALVDFEERWDREWRAAHPKPVGPPMQSSLTYGVKCVNRISMV